MFYRIEYPSRGPIWGFFNLEINPFFSGRTSRNLTLKWVQNGSVFWSVPLFDPFTDWYESVF